MIFDDLADMYPGCTAMVCGNGPSLEEIYGRTDVDIHIGVNTVCAKVRLDYTVLVDKPQTPHPTIPGDVSGGMPVEKIRVVQEHLGNAGDILVSSYGAKQWDEHLSGYLMFRANPMSHHLEYPGFRDEAGEASIPCFNGAPYAAAGIAAFMGCTEIVLAGVDYTGDHSWGRTTEARTASLEIKWLRLRQYLEGLGVSIRNGNPEARLEAIPAVV